MKKSLCLLPMLGLVLTTSVSFAQVSQDFLIKSFNTLSKGKYDTIQVYIMVPYPRFPLVSKKKEIDLIYAPAILQSNRTLAYHYDLVSKFNAAEDKSQFKFYVDGQLAKESISLDQIKAASADILSQITFISKRIGLYVDVSFRTENAGAGVMYQTEFERDQKKEPSQASGTTNNCKENLPLGYYYIWTVRNDKDSSDRNRKFEISEPGEIILKEKK